MNIADELRRAVDTCLGARPVRNPSHEAQRLLTEYRQRTADPQQRQRMDEAVADMELGFAAYHLGVHYQVQNQPHQAMRWLRAAAIRDIADAAVRLAMLHEYQSVVITNTSLDLTAGVDDLATARYWYEVAAAAGYTHGHDGQPGDTPMPLDCCPQAKKAAGVETAEEIINTARRQADALLRQARADVRTIIDTARNEVDDLAQQRHEVENQMRHLRHLVNGLAAAGSNIRIRRPERNHTPSRSAEEGTETEAWADMLDHFRRQGTTARGRSVLRALTTRIMTIFERARPHEPHALDLDVETRDAVPSQPPPSWAAPKTVIPARPGPVESGTGVHTG